MRLFRLLFATILVAMLLGCVGNFQIRRSSPNQKVRVAGIAKYDKTGVIVIARDGTPYYLEGDFEWDEKNFDKNVIVKGKLLYRKDSVPNDGLLIPAQIIEGEYFVIQNPQIRIKILQF